MHIRFYCINKNRLDIKLWWLTKVKFFKKEYNYSGKWAYGYHRGLWRTIEAARLRMSRFSQALKFSDSICEEIFEQRKVSNIVLLNVTNFSKKQKHFYEKKINPICFWKSEVLTLDNRQKSIDYVSDFIIENFNGLPGRHLDTAATP